MKRTTCLQIMYSNDYIDYEVRLRVLKSYRVQSHYLVLQLLYVTLQKTDLIKQILNFTEPIV